MSSRSSRSSNKGQSERDRSPSNERVFQFSPSLLTAIDNAQHSSIRNETFEEPEQLPVFMGPKPLFTPKPAKDKSPMPLPRGVKDLDRDDRRMLRRAALNEPFDPLEEYQLDQAQEKMFYHRPAWNGGISRFELPPPALQQDEDTRHRDRTMSDFAQRTRAPWP